MNGGRWRKKIYQWGSSSILAAEKIEDGGFSFFVPRKWKNRVFSVLREKKSYPLSSSVRSLTHSSGRRSKRGFFDLRLRRSKIEDGRFFDLRLRRSKMGCRRSSAPKNEERERSSNNTSFFEGTFLFASKNSFSLIGSTPRIFIRSSGPKIEEPPADLRSLGSKIVSKIVETAP